MLSAFGWSSDIRQDVSAVVDRQRVLKSRLEVNSIARFCSAQHPFYVKIDGMRDSWVKMSLCVQDLRFDRDAEG